MTPSLRPVTADGCGAAPHLIVTRTHRGRGDTSFERWVLGDGVWLMNLRFSGLSVSGPRRYRVGPSSRVLTVAVLEPGEWTLARDRTASEQRSGRPTLVGLDQSSSFDFRGPGPGSAIAVHILHARLSLSIETVRRGLDNLHPGVPLYPLVSDHIRQLGAVAASDPHLLGTLNNSTVGIVRSLLISAADLARARSSDDDLITRIERHIEEHLDHRDLGADAIAAAHNISVRQLYKTWPQTHGTPAGFIASRRLERARASLLSHRHLTITAIARKHGFTHATHFAQLFRAAYGVTPSGWRRANQSLSGQR